MSAGMRAAVTHASDAAFLHGLHTAMIVGAGLSIAAALVVALVQRGEEVAPEHAAGA